MIKNFPTDLHNFLRLVRGLFLLFVGVALIIFLIGYAGPIQEGHEFEGLVRYFVAVFTFFGGVPLVIGIWDILKVFDLWD